jgi:hypothetical protein
MENLVGLSPPPAPEPTPLPLDAAALAEYAGVYENPGEARLTLRVRDDGLELTPEVVDPAILQIQPPAPATPPTQLAFTAPDVGYVVDPPGLRVACLRNPNGSIAGLFQGSRFDVRR